jgi:hypothetical protein
MPRCAALEGSAVHGAGRRFRTQQIRGTDLHAGCAKRERGRHALRIGNAAGRNDWHLHCPHDLRQQRERADLRREVVGEENAPMPAGFETLRDDRIDAARFEPACFFDRRCR